jgi:uncharacterized membrane protein
MNTLIIAFVLFIILECFSKQIKEPLITEYSDKMIEDNLEEVIKYLNNSINHRKNGANSKNSLSGDKYQKQIVPLKNAVSYAIYIKNKVIK